MASAQRQGVLALAGEITRNKISNGKPYGFLVKKVNDGRHQLVAIWLKDKQPIAELEPYIYLPTIEDYSAPGEVLVNHCKLPVK